MTEELTQLLAILCEPASANPWLVDWLWGGLPGALNRHMRRGQAQPTACLAALGGKGASCEPDSLSEQLKFLHCRHTGLYREALQPFLILAGPASGGNAVLRFRECWACLPWRRASFHCASPGALRAAAHAVISPLHM